MRRERAGKETGESVEAQKEVQCRCKLEKEVERLRGKRMCRRKRMRSDMADQIGC